ncbi:MAG: 4-hydroxythreonine-4-phosphate dehydrogenase PdxA [Pseudomonadota bacterium]
MSGRPLIALTMGDPAGIGPEITLKAWAALRTSGAPMLAYATLSVLADAARAARAPTPIAVSSPEEARRIGPDALPVIDIPSANPAEAGQPDPAHAPDVIQSITQAVTAALGGEVDAVVTNPISKSVLYQAGFPFAGHTEFIAELCKPVPAPEPRGPVMMLAAPASQTRPGLRAALVTIHQPLREAIADVTTARIISTAHIVDAALRRDFGVEEPRLAVAGLNPHAGEGGALGREDIDVVEPAVMALRDLGLEAAGPMPPDTMFHEEARAQYDAAICLYHDQGLIPVKTLDFHRGVNITLGLPIIRTSPDHGTAFAIAGKGEARADSLIEALCLAGDLAAKRAAFDRQANGL